MEQLYLVEIFVDEITIFIDEIEDSYCEDLETNEEKLRKCISGSNVDNKKPENKKKPEKKESKEKTSKTPNSDKNFICKVKFGTKVDFNIIEDPSNRVGKKDDSDKTKRIIRTIRAGKSYLFPSYPETMIEMLRVNPLTLEVFNDDPNEEDGKIFVGVGTMYWNTEFYIYLRDTVSTCQMHKPLSSKSVTPLMDECCCRQCGEISFIVRISALGDSIVTEFKQILGNPDHFVFQTDKVPTLYECQIMESGDPNHKKVGRLYAAALLNDPKRRALANKKIEVCTNLSSCGVKQQSPRTCAPSKNEQSGPQYPVDKVKIGDIRGPCGNPNCELAHRVKTYIRNLDAYKKSIDARMGVKKEIGKVTNKVCGKCTCKDDTDHRHEMREDPKKSSVCTGCGGIVKNGPTCEEFKQTFHNTGVTPTASRMN